MVLAISVKQGDNLRKLRNCAVCIICGKASEAEGIAKALKITESRLRGHEIAEVENGFTFYVGKLTLTSGEEISYSVTSSTRQGIQSFAISAALILHILQPRFVLHAGVCAARKPDEELKTDKERETDKQLETDKQQEINNDEYASRCAMCDPALTLTGSTFAT